jgi:hypothetical protein
MDPASQSAYTGWARHLVRKKIYQNLIGNPVGLQPLGRYWLSQKDSVKMALKKYEGARVWNEFIRQRQGLMAGCCRQIHESSGYFKDGNFFTS